MEFNNKLALLLGQFRLRLNALYAMYIKEHNPQISIEEMLIERGIK